MLDKVIHRLKEEVAMDGYQGTSIDDMWNYIQRFLSEETNKLNNSDNGGKVFEPTMDTRYKSFFWHNLRHVPDLSFFLGKEEITSETEDNSPNDSSDDAENTRESMDTEIAHDLIDGITKLEYDQVESQYGPRLRVVADKELQEAQLFVGIPIGQTWSISLRNYLTTILQGREAGITQCELTKKWKTDPRSSGHFAKSLESKGAIHRVMVTYKGMRTNLCIHARFVNRDQSQGTFDKTISHNVNMSGVIFTKQVFRDRMVALLTDAKDNVMFSIDILSAMGFDLNNAKTKSWFNRAIDRHCHEGLIRKLAAQRNNAGIRQRCIQLLERNSDSLATQKYDDDDEHELVDTTYNDLEPFVMTSRNGLNSASKFLQNMPMDKQVLQVIQAAGDQGIINKDINIAIRCDNVRMTQRALDRLGDIQGDARFKYGLERALEFEGRNRRYRFYAYATYMKMQQSEPVVIPEFNPMGIKEAGLKETDYRAMKPGKMKKTAASGSTTPSGQSYSPPQHSDAVIPSMFIRTQQQASTPGDPSTGGQHVMDLSSPTLDTSIQQTEPIAPAPRRRGRPRKNAPKQAATPKANIETLQPPAAAPTTHYQGADTTVINPTIDNTTQQPSVIADLSIQPPPAQTSVDQASIGLISPTVPQQGEAMASSANNSSATDTSQPSDMKRPQPDVNENIAPRKRITRSSNTITGYFKSIVPRKDVATTEKTAAATTVAASPQPDVSQSATSAMATPTEAPVTPSVASPMPSSASAVSTPLAEEPATTTASRDTTPSTASEKRSIKRRTTTATPSMPKTFQQKPKPVQNKYFEERKQVLLALLEDKPVIEKSVTLRDRFLEKRTELFGDTGNSTHEIDMKTIWRSVVALKNEGLVHIYEGDISQLNGIKKKKQVMVHKSLDPNGPEVASYFEYLNELKILQPGTKLGSIEKASVAVESLEDRLTRMEQSKEQAVAAGKMAEAKRLDTEIQLIQGNKALSGETDLLRRKKVGNWLLIGIELGYINSFMVRVKMLHQYLLSLLLSKSGDDEGVDVVNRVISTTALVHRMPLSLFCIIIGVFTPTQEFSEYMADETRAAATLGTLPDNIRGCAFNEKNRSIFRLRLLIRSLIHLGVLASADPADVGGDGNKPEEKVSSTVRGPPQLKLTYKLATKATIKNYRHVDNPVIQEHSLCDQTELMLYWSELQYVCTKTNLSDDESATLCLDGVKPEDEECIRTLYTVRNWGHNMIFNRKQKEVMNEYVDKELSTTPYSSPAWCKSIALEIGATMEGVRTYYRKIEVAMGRMARVQKWKKELNQEQVDSSATQSPRRQAEMVQGGRQRRRRRRRIDDGIISENSRVISQATTSPFKYKRTCIPYAEQLAMEQRKQQLYVDDQGRQVMDGKFLDDNTAVPWLTQDDISSKLIKPRSKRSVWSMEEDDLLKLSYVIMNHRRENGCRFLWKPISTLLSRFKDNQCRRRLSIIRDNPKHAEDLQNIRIRWHRYYNQGVQNKDLAMWKTVGDNDFDLTKYLAYYLRQCQLDQEQDIPMYHIHLPANTRIIDQNFDISPITALNHQGDGFFEDAFHQKGSTIAMRQSLCLHGFVQRINSKESYDHITAQNAVDLDANLRIIELLKQLFKMILMTPAEVYDPFYANSIMSSYPEQLLKTAFAESRHAGVLIQAKGDRIGDRRIPKTIMGISERFMRNMTPQLPENIMMQASEYERYLMQATHTSLDPVQLNSGMMLCIFDLFSAGRLSIDMENLGGFIEKFSKPSHSARRINENNQRYGISLTITETRPIPHGPAKGTAQVIIPLTDNQIESTTKLLGDSLGSQMSKWIKRTVDYLLSRGNTGATVPELKLALLDDDNSGDLSDDLLISVIDALTSKASPPLAAFVGYTTLRLVLTNELLTWAILPKTLSATYLYTAHKRRRMLTSTPTSETRTTSEQVDQHTLAEESSSTTFHQINSGSTTPMSTAVSSPRDNEDDLLVTVKTEDVQPTPPVPSATTINDTSSTWAAKRQRPDDFGTVSGERQEELAQGRQDVVMPRMWVDINGHVTDSIWRACVKLVVGTIMHRPGVTYGHLCRIMNATLSPMEIKDLLNDLIRLGVLRQLSVSTGKAASWQQASPSTPKLGLFKSKHTARTMPPNTIDPAIQTSYWLLPGHYSKLSM